MIQIGITGGIACGKSTVLKQIQLMGHDVFSCDDAFKAIFETDIVQNWLQEQIILRKGEDGWEEYKSVGKTLIKYLMLSDAIFKKDYEALVHPMVRLKMLESNASVAEVPLLFETGAESCFDKVWVIACNPETQISRLMNRMGCDREYALAWINNQMPLRDKISRANRVIYTDGSEESVKELVKLALREDLIL